MELFYGHVLRYEDGQGVFEWGAGGIMHVHSINVGSCMPRVDPTAAGMQRPDGCNRCSLCRHSRRILDRLEFTETTWIHLEDLRYLSNLAKS